MSTTCSQKSADILIFDRDLIKNNRIRAQKNFHDYDFLFRWSKDILHDRLLDINRTFNTAIQIGSRGTFFEAEHPKIKDLHTMDLTPFPVVSGAPRYIQASEEFLPINSSSVDLIVSNLNIHTVNDLPGTLIQIKPVSYTHLTLPTNREV